MRRTMDELVGGAGALRRLRRPAHPHRRPRRAHQRTGQRPAPRHGQGPRPRGRGAALLQRRHRAGPGQLPGLLPDRHRPATAPPTACSGRRWSAAPASTRPSSTHDGRRVVIAAGRRPPPLSADRRRRRARHRTPTATPAPPGGGPRAGSRSGPSSGPARATRGATPTSGLWARSPAGLRLAGAPTLTVDALPRSCSPRRPTLEVDRYELANLLALNFVVHGLLGEGVASSTRPDPQAKSLGEYLRSRLVEVPVALLADMPAADDPR